MKKSVLSALIISALFTINSCDEKPDNQVGKADLHVEVNVNIDVFDLQSDLKSANAETDNFKVEIYNSGDELVMEFDNASDMPEFIELSPGSYYVKSYEGSADAVGFEQPYYGGISETFDLFAEESKTITVHCIIQNCAVSIIYSDNIKEQFDDYNTTVTSTAGSGSLLFNSTELRYGFFPVDIPITVDAVLEYDNGGGTEQKILTGAIPMPEAGKLYAVNLDASLESGTVGITITVNDELDEIIVDITEEEEPEESNWTGALIITEIMFNPDSLPDTDGEYVELYNPTDSTVVLDGIIFSDDNNSHSLDVNTTLQSGEYFIISTDEIAIEGDDYVYASLSLNNSGETLSLTSPDGQNICSLNYSSGFPDGKAASIQLSSDHLNAADYSDGNFWCTSTTPYTSGDPEHTGDLGTPGSANNVCGDE